MAILVAFDGSEPAEGALEYTLTQFPDEEIVVLNVIDPLSSVYGGEVGYAYDQMMDAKREDAEELLAEAEAMADEHGVEITTETAVGKAARRVVEYVEEHDIEQVIVGSHGRSGISRVLLGSVAEVIVRRSPVPVTIVR